MKPQEEGDIDKERVSTMNDDDDDDDDEQHAVDRERWERQVGDKQQQPTHF